jgi:hypothetical protein
MHAAAEGRKQGTRGQSCDETFWIIAPNGAGHQSPGSRSAPWVAARVRWTPRPNVEPPMGFGERARIVGCRFRFCPRAAPAATPV